MTFFFVMLCSVCDLYIVKMLVKNIYDKVKKSHERKTAAQ